MKGNSFFVVGPLLLWGALCFASSPSSAARDTVEVSSADSIATVTLDHPPMNTLDDANIPLLTSTISGLIGDPNVKVIVVTGASNISILGLDTSTLMSWDSPTKIERFRMAFSGLLNTIESSPKPVIFALLDGPTMGAALELALAFHLRVAGAGAQINSPETSIGMMPGGAMTQRLPRLIGQGRANEIILTGRVVSADEALAIGLVNRVSKKGGALAGAIELAGELTPKRSVSLSSGLDALYYHWTTGGNLNSGIAREKTDFDNVFDLDSVKLGLPAYLSGHPVHFPN